MLFSRIIAIALFTSLALVTSVSAQEDRGGKDRACVLDCREVFTRCSHAAYADGRICMQGCGELILAAREICAAAPDSEECNSARRQAAACVRECREALGAALRICRADAKECVELCPDAEPMVPADPVCLHECRRQARACLDRAHAAARDCAQDCADLVEKARMVCADAPRSDECSAARREASACLQPCRHALATQTRQCVSNGQACAASCPPAVSSPSTLR